MTAAEWIPADSVRGIVRAEAVDSQQHGASHIPNLPPESPALIQRDSRILFPFSPSEGRGFPSVLTWGLFFVILALKNNRRTVIIKYLYAALVMIVAFSAQGACGEELPSHCQEDPILAAELSQMGPVLGLGSSVSQGLMARSFSEIVAEQLCIGDRKNGHAFPWFLPISYPKIAKSYYKSMKPKLVLALDVTYHTMKFLEDTAAKKKELEALVAGLALDCQSALYDCSANGNESYVITEGYKPTVLLGDIFFESLIDCDQSTPRKHYTIENSKNHRNKELCFDEYSQLNRYLRDLAAKYPNVHILPANRLFTALQNYPNSIFYDEGNRQTFFSRQELTWDGWHPWTNPGSYVFANLTILEINRLIKAGKISGHLIPLREISDQYFGPPSGLIILAPAGFPPVGRPQITGPDGSPIPLRFALSKEWAARHGPFSIGTSYLRARALAWDRLGPRPLVLRARSFTGTALVFSKEDRDVLISHYQNGVSFKGALILIGADLNEDIVSKEDSLFLRQIKKDKNILKTLAPTPVAGDVSSWEYSSIMEQSEVNP